MQVTGWFGVSQGDNVELPDRWSEPRPSPGGLSPKGLCGEGGMGRGLHNFIRDLKNAATPDKEAKRVREELAKIRAKFRGEKELDT